MPSQYQPQIFGWISDLVKGGNYLTGADQRLLYANDNYCAFIRKTKSDQILYLCMSFFLSISGIFLIPSLIYSIITCNSDTLFYLLTSGLFCYIILEYLMIPEFYQNLFTRRGSPIIFNRKTGKVYINESYFFNFKVLRNPLTFLHPNKKRIKEYDWAHLQGVVVHNFSRSSLNTTILMVCKPHTHKTIDHILLDPLRAGIGSYLVWGWVNNFMCANKLAGLNDGKYKWEQETQFKDNIIKGQGWPEWMVEAFNATSQAELAEIKQRHHVKQ
ncbi:MULTISPECIES: DUF6708 domain-containing protein [unclassified Gilliamella]|uniref:DUF6708 domain-containing protein n=4 Tax=Gilliamella TaxID=1193503 RepID=UPI00080DE987|nr:DUF6708 domain-containing protein [Gilliamella apicola]OCG19094.1 hypothetical protein A9G23_01155 [Gilliamella apicola]OCG20969.1 hypothetical protein A9G23_05340 [Gilliamella apicola]OCG21411.1 hypothetical protein A9G22_09850 [Gilliamella apicola]OCG24031.1 hypothetical protein A9G22_05225 [Gilliamella apicola]OCG25498.1 hypothetical protein A9G22_02770 [Gilliamella apicola]